MFIKIYYKLLSTHVTPAKNRRLSVHDALPESPAPYKPSSSLASLTAVNDEIEAAAIKTVTIELRSECIEISKALETLESTQRSLNDRSLLDTITQKIVVHHQEEKGETSSTSHINDEEIRQKYPSPVSKFIKYLKIVREQIDQFAQECLEASANNEKEIAKLQNSIATTTARFKQFIRLIRKNDIERLIEADETNETQDDSQPKIPLSPDHPVFKDAVTLLPYLPPEIRIRLIKRFIVNNADLQASFANHIGKASKALSAPKSTPKTSQKTPKTPITSNAMPSKVDLFRKLLKENSAKEIAHYLHNLVKSSYQALSYTSLIDQNPSEIDYEHARNYQRAVDLSNQIIEAIKAVLQYKSTRKSKNPMSTPYQNAYNKLLDVFQESIKLNNAQLTLLICLSLCTSRVPSKVDKAKESDLNSIADPGHNHKNLLEACPDSPQAPLALIGKQVTMIGETDNDIYKWLRLQEITDAILSHDQGEKDPTYNTEVEHFLTLPLRCEEGLPGFNSDTEMMGSPPRTPQRDKKLASPPGSIKVPSPAGVTNTDSTL